MYRSHLLTIPFVLIHFFLMTGQQADTVFIDQENEVKAFKISTYYPNGAIASETYVDREFRSLGREELFMRGLPGDYAEKGFYDTRNHGVLYWPDGRIKAWKEYTGLLENIYYQEYKEDGQPGWITADHRNGPLPILMAFSKSIAFDRRYDLVEGRIGSTLTRNIRIESLVNFPITLTFQSNAEIIQLPSKILIDPRETVEIPVKILMPEEITEGEVLIANKEGQEIAYKITIRGHHLNPLDLSPTRETAPIIHLSGENMIVHGDNPNKIIHVFKNKRLIESIPTSQLRSIISLKKLRKGKPYLIESIDLTTNSSKFCLVQLEK